MFWKKHTKLICDIAEISNLIHGAHRLEDVLAEITQLITRHMNCEVCSIYLFDEKTQELILKATKGLDRASIDNVRMKMGEGLTGLALKEKRVIYEGNALQHPKFKFFAGIGEERYASFLAVPIHRGSVDIGVVVVQSIKIDYFSPDDRDIFQAITAQLGSIVETARLLLNIARPQSIGRHRVSLSELKFLKGKIGCEGVVYGPIVVLDKQLTDFTSLIDEAKEITKADVEAALVKTREQLENLQQEIQEKLYDVAGLIFGAQLMMLKDETFTHAIDQAIDTNMHPMRAIVMVVEAFASQLAQVDDDYLKERAQDIKDIGRRILENLGSNADSGATYQDRIVIAHELFPSDALKLYTQQVKGIILLSGGVTGHVAILARSLNIPMVIVQEPALVYLSEDTPVLLDATMGYVHINPEQHTCHQVLSRDKINQDIEHLRQKLQADPATKDGCRISLFANINLLGDLKAANAFAAHGIGLYRSEFPFMIRSDFPTEEEQVQIYTKVFEGMKNKPVVLRTLDIGGDKLLSYFDNDHEDNPFLGLRSIRFSLKHPEIFKTQLRAMLRAGAGHDLHILFPMISSVDDFLQAKGLAQECQQELQGLGKEYHSSPKFGVMIELPSAVALMDALAHEADFISVGTNDLIQYVLGVDRTNERVASMYVGYHPAVLKAISIIMTASNAHQKKVSICGDMARDPVMIPVLLGLGVRHLSMDARYLPMVHELLSTLEIDNCEDLAKTLLEQTQLSRIQHILGI